MNVPSSGRIGFVRSHRPRTRVILRRSFRTAPRVLRARSALPARARTVRRRPSPRHGPPSPRTRRHRGFPVAVRYRQAVAALSLSGAFALALAHRTGSTLLTRDARLRRLAIDKKVVCAASSGSSTECFESAQQHRNSCTTALSASVTTRVAGFPRPKSTDASRLSSGPAKAFDTDYRSCRQQRSESSNQRMVATERLTSDSIRTSC